MRRSGLLRRPGRRWANPPSGSSRLFSTGEGPNRRDGRRKPFRPATVSVRRCGAFVSLRDFGFWIGDFGLEGSTHGGSRSESERDAHATDCERQRAQNRGPTVTATSSFFVRKFVAYARGSISFRRDRDHIAERTKHAQHDDDDADRVERTAATRERRNEKRQ